MSKTISINPDLFKISSNGGTRKRKEKDPNAPKIQVKTPKEKNKTTKRSILKFIRNHQERNYRKLMDDKPIISTSTKKHNESDNFNSDFEESLKYLMDIAKENETKQKDYTKQQTLKNHQFLSPNVFENVSLKFPSDYENKPLEPVSLNTNLVLSNNIPAIHLNQTPLYSCLKGGNLPTYRQLYNKTVKNYNNPITTNNSFSQQSTGTFGSNTNLNNPSIIGGKSTQINNNLINTQQNKQDIFIKQIQESKNKPKLHNKLRYPKQKKTLRRTFKIGKSKIHPKVSVLISNRTIRNNITTKAQQLKQTSLQDVQRYLLKHGFIKIGSSAPNDVLRKMYESAVMICGEVHNHNPDNLLYNFFHDDNIMK